MQSLALIKLFNLVSPALPIGAFSYSQGLEWAIEEGGINTPDAIKDWIQNVMSESLCQTDIPALKRLCTGFQQNDADKVHHWNQWILASRETQQLLDEDRTVGKALVKLLEQQGVNTELLPVKKPVSLVTAWALASFTWEISIQTSAIGFCWSWIENQIAVASKTLPLGQTAAQKIIAAISPGIESASLNGLNLTDDEMGQSLPGWVMACAHHETQYSRLFRS